MFGQGFKRVYHKEEFQRTEHFFDDEDAKRIAESYGIKDAKKDINHEIKDDDRKYHVSPTLLTFILFDYTKCHL